MPSHLVLSTDNYDSSTGQIYVEFPFQQNFKNTQLAVANLTLYNSFGNVSTVLQNNKISVYWPDGGGHTQFQFTLPDGFYTMKTLNTWLKTQCDENYLYVVDTTDTKIYPFILGENTAYNTIIVFRTINQSHTKPTGATWEFPTNTSSRPYIDFHTTTLSHIFGYSETQIGDGTTSIFENTRVPQPRNVNSLIVCCNLIQDAKGYSQKSDILSTIPISANFGSTISRVYPKLEWMNINPNQYQSLSVQFYDQNLKRVNLLDPNFLLVLAFREAPKMNNKK